MDSIYPFEFTGPNSGFHKGTWGEKKESEAKGDEEGMPNIEVTPTYSGPGMA